MKAHLYSAAGVFFFVKENVLKIIKILKSPKIEETYLGAHLYFATGAIFPTNVLKIMKVWKSLKKNMKVMKTYSKVSR